MALTKKIGAYSNVVAVFEKVLENEGGILEFKTTREAISWQQRAYHYRRLPDAPDDYDHIQIQLDRDTATLTFRVAPLDAVFKTPEGEEVHIDITPPPRGLYSGAHIRGFDDEEDDLLADAARLVGKLP